MIPKEVLQKVRRIEIRTRSVVDSILSGEYQSVFKGRGMEFSEVRTYTEGDDVRSIDWNVTARMGQPYVKKHVEERELTVMLVVDASSSGHFGSVSRFKDEVAVELCALLAFSAIKNNDRVGLIIFTSDVEKYIPPKKGKNHVLRVIRELLYFRPVKRGTDIGAAIGFLNRVITKKSVVFLVSDFLNAGYEVPVRVASHRHDFVAITVTDPREKELPAVGLIELQDPETGAAMLVDSRDRNLRRAFTSEAERRGMELSAFFRANGIDEIQISTGADYVDPLVRFFRKREKMFR
ncbi:MAG TPA: DUF58 domain-containing protein [Chitinivibrionales bacterium]|jgi:uncharacterized protein (DUF58 family)|nr:DUF58 domain-containing protein [Chitinivibrionales bacterium]